MEWTIITRFRIIRCFNTAGNHLVALPEAPRDYFLLGC
jgi:hypothetical protein